MSKDYHQTEQEQVSTQSGEINIQESTAFEQNTNLNQSKSKSDFEQDTSDQDPNAQEQTNQSEENTTQANNSSAQNADSNTQESDLSKSTTKGSTFKRVFKLLTTRCYRYKRFFFKKEDSIKHKQRRCRTYFRRIITERYFRSLSFRLMMIVAVSAFIGTLTMGLMSYFRAYNATRDFIDEELSQIASVAINYRMTIPRRWEFPKQHHDRILRLRRREDGRILLQIIENNDKNILSHQTGRQGQGMRNGQNNETADNFLASLIANTLPSLSDIHDLNYDIIIAPLYGRPTDALYIPPGVDDGFYTVLVADERVRAFVATNISGQRFAVARPLKSLDVITTQSVIASIWQFFVIYLVSLPIIFFTFKLTFATLNKVARSLHHRAEDDLSPIVVDKGFLPYELDGFITSINRLFRRVNDGIKSKQRFIADAAHEMRTPLTALSLQVDSLDKEDLPPKVKEKVKRLKEGISRERELMTALLTLAREQNHDSLMPETINILDLYIKLIEEQGLLADNKNIDLGVEGEANFDLVTDRTKLVRIMSNLVSNAIKYTPEDGRIDLMVQTLDDGSFKLMVQDNGPGIPQEHIEHIMEPFYRVHGDCSEVQGTGLGLAIVKASCDSLGAKLNFENVEPHGLCASVTLKNLK